MRKLKELFEDYGCLVAVIIALSMLVGTCIGGIFDKHKEKESSQMSMSFMQNFDEEDDDDSDLCYREKLTGQVYICRGRYSHAYHSHEYCYGLKTCKGKMIELSIKDALRMRRTPCHYCHPEDMDDLWKRALYNSAKSKLDYDGDFDDFLYSLDDDDFCYDIYQGVVDNSALEENYGVSLDYDTFKILLGS